MASRRPSGGAHPRLPGRLHLVRLDGPVAAGDTDRRAGREHLTGSAAVVVEGGTEKLEGLAVEEGPGARLRVHRPDPPVDPRRVVVPVDAREVARHFRGEGRGRVV